MHHAVIGFGSHVNTVLLASKQCYYSGAMLPAHGVRESRLRRCRTASRLMRIAMMVKNSLSLEIVLCGPIAHSIKRLLNTSRHRKHIHSEPLKHLSAEVGQNVPLSRSFA